MSQEFLDMLEDDLQSIHFGPDDFTDPATYIPAIGDPYSLDVLFNDPYEAAEPFSGTAKVQTQSITVMVREKAIIGGVKKGDRLTVRSTEYKVISAEPDGVGVLLLALHKA